MIRRGGLDTTFIFSTDLRDRPDRTLHKRNTRCSRDLIFLKDVQRIVDRFHVDARETSPDAADRVKRTIAEPAQFELGEPSSTILRALSASPLDEIHQPQRTKRQ